MDNDQWKDEILMSMQGAQRAEPNPFLFARIEAALAEEPLASPRFRRLALGFGTALLVVNLSLIWWHRQPHRSRGMNTSVYTIATHSYQLY